jgi:hypothetical protein
MFIAAEHRITLAALPSIVHLLPGENADGRSGLPKNVLESTLPVVLSREPVNAFCIYAPTFSPQHHRQPSITVPDPRAGQIPQPDT